MNNNIVVNQNEPANIRKLQAQRQLYKEAKKLVLSQIILAVPITIVLSFLKLIPKEWLGFSFAGIAVLYSVLLVLLDFAFIQPVIHKYRKQAANIQEQFDCAVYGMDFNKICAGKPVSAEVINKFAARYVDDPKAPLPDWYPLAVAPLSQAKAIQVCQKTNLWYDSELRNRYRNGSVWVGIVLFILLFLVGLIQGMDINSFFVVVVLPFVPALVVIVRIHLEHGRAAEAAAELHQRTEALSDEYNDPSMDSLRKVQDQIYIHRKASPLIPEYFYKKKRPGLEDQMNQNAAEAAN